MNIAVLSNKTITQELPDSTLDMQYHFFEKMPEKSVLSSFDAFIQLEETAATYSYDDIGIPVFINSVSFTLQQFQHPSHVVRFNGWSGFLKRDMWELAGEMSIAHQAVLKAMGKTYVVLPDEPGFISARVLAMIINEAFFARESGVSTEADIDIAMKLGTNYPMGPFEWADVVGVKNVWQLLKTLSVRDSKYNPSVLLEKSINE